MFQSSDLTGRRALVYGGGTGIGFACATAVAAQGAAVCLSGRRPEPLLQARNRLATYPAVHCFPGDACAEKDVAGVTDSAAAAMGGLDVVIISAGVGGITPIDTTSVAEFRRICDGNTLPMFLATQYAMPHLRQAGRGAIIVISSMFGVIGYRNRVAYCAAKAAVIAMARSLALDLAPDRITVNAICPGFIDTELSRAVLAQVTDVDKAFAERAASTPLGRIGRPEEIGALAAYLASDGGAWTTGQQFIVDGGFTAQ